MFIIFIAKTVCDNNYIDICTYIFILCSLYIPFPTFQKLDNVLEENLNHPRFIQIVIKITSLSTIYSTRFCRKNANFTIFIIVGL